MHRQILTVLYVLVSPALLWTAACGSNPPTSRDPGTATEEASSSAEERMAAYEARERAARERRIARAEEQAAVRIAQGDQAADRPARPAALQRFMDADGRNMCNIRFQNSARSLFGSGQLYRWTEVALEARFPRKREAGSVTTYIGDAIEFRDDDGSWLRAVYECDYDHDASEIVDVRTSEGRRR